MAYIVLDMEWNCAKRRNQMIDIPFRLYGEIIQIGAVKLNNALKVIGEFNRTIKPDFYKHMNKEVQNVTLITDSDLQKGVAFTKAIREFKTWCNPDDVILTWGDSDIRMLIDNLDFRDMDTAWIPEAFNAQWMFDDQVTMQNRQYSLDYARFKFGIKGRNAHNALNDAYNTAEVLTHLDVAEWIEEERAYMNDWDETSVSVK